MMKENDKWINSLRGRMENYSEPAPTGLWEELEQELNAPRKVIPLWRRWQAVAAVALLVIVTSLNLWWAQSPSAVYIEQQSAELGRVFPVTEVDVVAPTTSEAIVAQHLPVEPASVKPKHVVARQTMGEVPVEVEPEETSEVKEKATAGAEPQIEETYSEEQQTLSPTVKATQQGKGRSTRTNSTYVYKEKKARNWSIGVSTSNSGLPSSTHTDGYLPLPRAAKGMYVINSGSSFLVRSGVVAPYAYQPKAEQGKSDVNYRMPIILGASVRWDLNRNWAIETGVTYTQLSSETTSGDRWNQYTWEEKLHYVGIPLKVHRRIWESKRFEVYVSAGGAVEKCVSGRQTMMQHTTEGTEPAEADITVKPLQWSVAAAAGAQFKLTEQLGIYAEPGITYYFDDGSTVNTIRKEHPLNFHLQVGLRLTFSK